MTKKHEVDLNTYKKAPRRLSNAMLDALRSSGELHPLLAAVRRNDKLRLEIRDRRFNIYYGGGSLLLVDGRTTPWTAKFDKKYFSKGNLTPPPLPPECVSLDDAHACVTVFPEMMAGMDDWWGQCPKGERGHCQTLAATSTDEGLALGDYMCWTLSTNGPNAGSI